MKRLFNYLFILTLLFSFFTKSVSAESIIFQDDFSDGVADGWQESAEWGSWIVSNGEYIGSATLFVPGQEKPSYSFPTIGGDDYVFEIDIKSSEGVDKGLMIRFKSMTDSYYAINLRSALPYGAGNDLNLVKVTPANVEILSIVPCENLINEWYHLKIIADGSLLKIYVDNDLKITYEDSSFPILKGGVALQVWPGGHTNGLNDVTRDHYDNILVSKIGNPSSPLFFLPGMVGCWNGQALLRNQSDPGWRLFKIAKNLVYKNLFMAFDEADMEEDKDWYTFCYDWRQPLEDNAIKLGAFVDEKTEAGETVNLLGHSMGGLIGRVFTQNNPEKVEKLIMAGSPNEGVVRAYPAWEGGQLWGFEKWQKLLVDLYLRMNKSGNEHRVQTIRRLVPSLKDLLPTFDFLVSEKTKEFKPIANHNQQNTTLLGYNGALTTGNKEKMRLLAGDNFETLESLLVTTIGPHANWAHQVLGLWEDGEPIHNCGGVLCEYSDHGKDYSPSRQNSLGGDGTVLLKSVLLPEIEETTFPLSHAGIVQEKEALEQMLAWLGSEAEITAAIAPESLGGLLFWLRSPANIKISDNLGKEAGFGADPANLIEGAFYDEAEKFLFLPHAGENYILEVTGEGGGEYEIIAGENTAGESKFWEYTLGTEEGKVDTFNFFSEKGLELIGENESLPLASAHEELNSFHQNKCFRAVRLSLEKSKREWENKNYAKANLWAKKTRTTFLACGYSFSEDKMAESFNKFTKIDQMLFEFLLQTAQESDYQVRNAVLEKSLAREEKFFAFLERGLAKRNASLFLANLLLNLAEAISQAKEDLAQEKYLEAWAQLQSIGFWKNWLLTRAW